MKACLLLDNFLPLEDDDGDEMDEQVHLVYSLTAIGKLLEGLGIAGARMQVGTLLVLESREECLLDVLNGQHMRHEVLNGNIIDLIPGENIIRRDYTSVGEIKVQVMSGQGKLRDLGKGNN